MSAPHRPLCDARKGENGRDQRQAKGCEPRATDREDATSALMQKSEP